VTYLNQYDQISADQVSERLKLVNKWIRMEWRPFFAEVRQNRPIFPIPGITLVTRFSDVVEVLCRHREFTCPFGEL
jgi:hypothetical protein